MECNDPELVTIGDMTPALKLTTTKSALRSNQQQTLSTVLSISGTEIDSTINASDISPSKLDSNAMQHALTTAQLGGNLPKRTLVERGNEMSSEFRTQRPVNLLDLNEDIL